MIDPHKIWQSAQLPSLPIVAFKLIELSRSPDTGIAQIVATIKSDPAIVARLLKASNSSLFGQSSKVKSIDQAVVLLGTTAVTALALGFSLVDTSLCHGPLGEAYTNYWLQSTVHATSAKMLAKRYSAANQEDMFLAGLLLDLGRLAMLKTIAKEYQPVIAAAMEQEQPLIDVEKQLLGISHIEVGIELMRRWGMPDELMQMTQWHHETTEGVAANPEIFKDVNLRTAIFSAAVGDYFCSSAKGLALDRLRKLASAFFNFSQSDLDAFLCDIRENINETADLFSIDARSVPSPADLLAQANEQLAFLTVSAQAATVHANARQEAAEHEIRKLEVKHEQLKQQAIRDPLTSLYNRTFFDESLSREVDRCNRYAQPVGVIFFDADRFKQVNDTYGHPFGDEVLKRIAKIAGETVRGADLLARYGGEEFVVLINQPSEKTLEKMAERIRAGIAATDLFHQGQRIIVTVSVGAAIAIPERHHESAGADIVATADQAMYEAKQAGRNQVRLRNMMSDFDRQVIPLVLQRRFSRWLVSKGAVDPSNAAKALLHCQTERLRLGEIAEQIGLLTPSEIEAIRNGQTQTGLRFGEVAVQLGLVDLMQLAGLIAWQQENPRSLAVELARLGLCNAARLESLIDAYATELTGARVLPARV
ncbi:MAG TPA: HDOD domain-containing protein [Planctomycetaceae bacterium]